MTDQWCGDLVTAPVTGLGGVFYMQYCTLGSWLFC